MKQVVKVEALGAKSWDIESESNFFNFGSLCWLEPIRSSRGADKQPQYYCCSKWPVPQNHRCWFFALHRSAAAGHPMFFLADRAHAQIGAFCAQQQKTNKKIQFQSRILRFRHIFVQFCQSSVKRICVFWKLKERAWASNSAAHIVSTTSTKIIHVPLRR